MKSERVLLDVTASLRISRAQFHAMGGWLFHMYSILESKCKAAIRLEISLQGCVEETVQFVCKVAIRENFLQKG